MPEPCVNKTYFSVFDLYQYELGDNDAANIAKLPEIFSR